MQLEEKRASLYVDLLNGRYNLALLQAKALMKEYPRIGDVSLDLIEVLSLKGDKELLKEVLSDTGINRIAKDDLRMLYRMSKEYYHLKNYDKCICFLKVLLNEFQHNPLFYYNLGNSYYSKGDYLKAISSYEEAIKCAPMFERAFYNSGTAYFKLGDLNEAIKKFDGAVKISKKPDALYNLALCYIEKKELQDAYYYLAKIPADFEYKYKPARMKQQIKDLIVCT